MAVLRIARQIQQMSRFDEQGPPPDQEHSAAQIEPDGQEAHGDRRVFESMTSAAV